MSMRNEDCYAPILEETSQGLQHLDPEKFKPLKGTILIIRPPEIKTVGSLHLPGTKHYRPDIARVAAVPDDPACPVDPGDWVVFRKDAPVGVSFGDRTDVQLLFYGPEFTDLVGRFDPADVPTFDLVKEETEEKVLTNV